jgi:hypothetical protein
VKTGRAIGTILVIIILALMVSVASLMIQTGTDNSEEQTIGIQTHWDFQFHIAFRHQGWRGLNSAKTDSGLTLQRGFYSSRLALSATAFSRKRERNRTNERSWFKQGQQPKDSGEGHPEKRFQPGVVADSHACISAL